MPKNNRFHFRMDNDEYNKVKLNLKAKGYTQISDYLRSLALEHDILIQERILRIDKNARRILELLES